MIGQCLELKIISMIKASSTLSRKLFQVGSKSMNISSINLEIQTYKNTMNLK